jgi:hypothetical protein
MGHASRGLKELTRRRAFFWTSGSPSGRDGWRLRPVPVRPRFSPSSGVAPVAVTLAASGYWVDVSVGRILSRLHQYRPAPHSAGDDKAHA